jgi:hypothetical protein
MEQKLKSEGKCLFCNQSFPQKEIGKHLATHLAKMEKDDSSKSPETFCHIVVEDGVLFLHLLVKGKVAMKKIDTFLRDIWLDCCGHMSNFANGNSKIAATQKVADVFETNVKIQHDYDYGDTTRVDLKGIKNYNLKLKEDIVLLSRNEPLKLICAKCEKHPAANVCTVCDWDFYCESCSAKHEKECADFGDYAKMPVVNSPRMGVCGYMGGHIDKERDGVHQ